MTKYFIGAAIIILVGVGGYYVFATMGKRSTQTTPSSTMQTATSTYATSTFSVVYPQDYTVNDSYAYDQFGPNKLIHGVKFVIPGAMATGTNLSANDTGVSVEQLPRAQHCTGDIYLSANVKASTVNENGVEYSLATSSDAGAGNRYEETVYALTGSQPCTAVRYFIHYAAIENFPAGTVSEFDHSALTSAFDTIRRSLVLTPTTP